MGLRWVVTGCNGQLGRAMVERVDGDPESELIAAVDIDDVDLSAADQVATFFAGFRSRADVLVNAAAFTHVDRCERESDLARKVNEMVPGLLAEACREAGVRLVHVSTDYVFAGDRVQPYTEKDLPAPRSVYGRTKLEGEQRVLSVLEGALIVRTSWLFGAGRNFIGAILAQAAERRSGRASGPLRVVDDQHGRPTYAVDLAGAICTLVEGRARGLFHVANRGVATWWDLARKALDEAGFADVDIERIRTGQLDLDAPRPAWSVLDCSRAEAAGVRMRSWSDAVRAYLASDLKS